MPIFAGTTYLIHCAHKLPAFIGSWGKQENSRKPSIFASLITRKPLTVWITTNCGQFLKWWECQTTLPVSWETCMQVKKQQLVLDIEKWISSKLGKNNDKDAYCHPAYLTYMQSTSCEMLGWVNHKLESRLLGEITTASDREMIPIYWQKGKRSWRAF